MTMIDTTSIFKNIQSLKELYPDDVNIIETNALAARELVEGANWAQNEVTVKLVEASRKEILNAKVRLATDRTLIDNPIAQKQLWFIIESREWFLKVATLDYAAAINNLNNDLERELQL